MRRVVGFAIAAVVVSITVGVLIGLVIHMGRSQRADDPPPTAEASSSDHASSAGGPSDIGGASGLPGDAVTDHTAGDLPPGGGSAGSSPWPLDVTSVTTTPQPPDGTQTSTVTVTAAPPSDHSPATGAESTSTGRSTRPDTPSSGHRRHGTNGSTTTGPRVHHTTGTASSPSRRHHTTSDHASSTAPTTRTAGTTGTADAPDGRCRALGEKSATAGGTTLFCQHDQTDGSLRWRAVTNGGGCLNQTMTGIGVDGHHYACRLGPQGLNHWKRTR